MLLVTSQEKHFSVAVYDSNTPLPSFNISKKKPAEETYGELTTVGLSKLLFGSETFVKADFLFQTTAKFWNKS